ncbi:hypothetical protein GPALN_012175 [Globodera pallida]|nr:hypothetical protein GPALN_012175 [Globodera pallida]
MTSPEDINDGTNAAQDSVAKAVEAKYLQRVLWDRTELTGWEWRDGIGPVGSRETGRDGIFNRKLGVGIFRGDIEPKSENAENVDGIVFQLLLLVTSGRKSAVLMRKFDEIFLHALRLTFDLPPPIACHFTSVPNVSAIRGTFRNKTIFFNGHFTYEINDFFHEAIDNGHTLYIIRDSIGVSTTMLKAQPKNAKYHQREEALANQHQNEREEWERKMVETKRKFEMERQKFEQKMRLKRQEQTEQLAQMANERKRHDEQQQQR